MTTTFLHMTMISLLMSSTTARTFYTVVCYADKHSGQIWKPIQPSGLANMPHVISSVTFIIQQVLFHNSSSLYVKCKCFFALPLYPSFFIILLYFLLLFLLLGKWKMMYIVHLQLTFRVFLSFMLSFTESMFMLSW